MTQPSRARLDEAVAQLARVWSQRSLAERAAFADQVAAVSAPSPPGDALQTIRERAALCGAVTPADLARGLDGAEASRALDLLAPEFDRVHVAGRWKWTLRTESRRDALTRLVDTARLASRLADVAGIATDRAGELLRTLVAGRDDPQSPAVVVERDPATAVQALTWAGPLGGFGAGLAEARRRAAVRVLREAYGALIGHGVYGRDGELAELRAFAEAQPDGGGAVPLLPLTGIGGAGKSTVLGEFITPYLDRIEQGDPDVPVVVVLDFDRIMYSPAAELELSFELTRQLGYAAPAASRDLSELRDEFRAQQRRAGSDRHVSNVRSDSATREEGAFDRRAGRAIRAHSLRDRPALLVLDAFEEWQREPRNADDPSLGAPELRILAWIGRIHSSMGLANLRVVASGRASLAETTKLASVNVRPPLVVADLDPRAASELLCALGVARSDAPGIARLAGGNPLWLHVAARFYKGLDPAARRDLLTGDSRAAEELTADVRAMVLYRRFLAHIPDEQVRKLAHPGLALRRITPELVRNVLAGPCGLGELDWRQATDLTARLAGEVWLVRRTPDGLYHRPEVRGPMLKLMANDPAHREVGPRIHAAAVDWYEHIGARPDRLSPGRAQVEALYHSLMLKSGDEPVAAVDGPDAELWRRLAQQLGPAVDELPGKVAIQVRVLRGDPIDDEDAGLLPDSVWRHWIEARGRALVDNGAAAAALDLFGTRESAALPEWLGQACLDVARWDQYWPTVRGFRGTLRDPLLVSGRYALLTGLLSQDDADLADYAAASSGYFSGLLGEGAASRASSESLFCDLLLELGMPSPWRGDVAWWRDAAWWRIPGAGAIDVTDRFPVDQLRRALTWLASPTPDATFVVGDVAALWRPDLTWMRNFARLADEQYEAALTPFLARFDSAVGGAPGMTAHQLLGEWSRDYADALGGPEIRLRLSRVREAADEVRALRGDNPELRPVIQLALAGTDVRELAGIAERLLPVPAADLRASALPEGSLSDRRTLVQLVEYIDRSGVMRAFLTAARRRWPEAELLQRVAAAFDTWDDVNNRLLDALTARLRHHRD